MSDIIKTFPANETEATAYLYVQNQDLSGKTATQIYQMYKDAYSEITDYKISIAKPHESITKYLR